MTWRDNLVGILLVAYLVGIIATYGHFVSRSEFCGHDKALCKTDRVMMGIFPAVAWPLYWSTKAWEK